VKVIRLDGEIQTITMNEAAAYAWLHNNQPHSVHYATTYGGYTVEDAEKKRRIA
jgi:hypothetical protein